jgi:prolyl-tRNA synthetase
MMGGSISHEFMLLTSIGEDSIVTCKRCDYRANMEAAESIVENDKSATKKPLEKVHTPNMKTIEDVCGFLRIPIENSCKAVVYQKNATDEYIVVFIRGDLDINETKLGNFLHEEVYPAVIAEESGIVAGFIGPRQMSNVIVLFDQSLKGLDNLCCGANEVDYHYIGFNIERDYGSSEFYDFSKATEGGICPGCRNHSLAVLRGVEVGHIFQLGTRYTESMKMNYIDENGNSHHPIMGCYGIGIGRLAASVCEVKHDEYGPIWPLSIAPWQVHLCCVRADDKNVKEIADKLYSQLQSNDIEVIYDDRIVSAGVMFSDADLLGVPIRVIVSPRNMKEGCCEIVTRDKSVSQKVRIDEVIIALKKMLDN